MQEVHNSIVDVAACEASDRLTDEQLVEFRLASKRWYADVASPDLRPEVRDALQQAHPVPVMKSCPEGAVEPHLLRYQSAVQRLRLLLKQEKSHRLPRS
jgi:hypothetical protein